MKPKLLVFELWRVGDLAIATPFIQAATERFDVTVLAQPVARTFQQRFWPTARLVDFVVPWTAFYGKYRLHAWPWKGFWKLLKELRDSRFDAAVSARWDLREHLLLRLTAARERFGFPNRGSRVLLTRPLMRLGKLAHRYDDWWVAAQAVGVDLPARNRLPTPPARATSAVLIHTGAAYDVRVWPLERYRNLVLRLRKKGLAVQVACDAGQLDWWVKHGETGVAVPKQIDALLDLIDGAGAFIGNDSGPGHLAALLGVPTFTFFGPQLSEWFAPVHPRAQWIDGKPCPYKQCFDYCRFPRPHCIQDISEAEAFERIDRFLALPSV